ncbi:transposase [Cyanobacteria bacterium FACHB-471]|nr:transposase [Cyanobacteria bacterium FACHB-471]
MVEPRPAKPTVRFVDEYCQWYQSLFAEVRSFEAFKQLHLGLLSEAKRKTLPAIATVAGLENAQSLHHFLTESPWQAEQFRQQRLQVLTQFFRYQSDRRALPCSKSISKRTFTSELRSFSQTNSDFFNCVQGENGVIWF